MKLNQLIIGLLFLFTIFIVLIPYGLATDYCLQQQTNNFTSGDGNCTLSYNGSYSIEDINGTYTGYVYVNYTIPTNATLNNSLWKVKHGINNNLSNLQALHYNVSIPNYCVNDSDTLQLRIFARTTGDNLNPPNRYGTSYGECFNGINWTIITNTSYNTSKEGSVCYDGTPPSDGSKIFDGNYDTSTSEMAIVRFTHPKNVWRGSCVSTPQYLFHAGLWWEESMIWDLSPINITIPPMNMTNCTEIWYPYYEPTICMNGTQIKYYEDLNSCNTTTSLPIDNGTSVGCVVQNNCADEICLNPVYANETCCVVTPTISCSDYNYLLYNNNGSIIESGNLTVFNQATNSYFYYFTQDVGTYYTKICDESTRQINVVERTGMTITDWTIIIMLILWVTSLTIAILYKRIIFLITGLISLFMTILFISLGYEFYIYIITVILTIVFLWIGFFGIKGDNE